MALSVVVVAVGVAVVVREVEALGIFGLGSVPEVSAFPEFAVEGQSACRLERHLLKPPYLEGLWGQNSF